ncbi:SAM-dependent methyltransferase [Cytobacillus sp. IB215316]|uniref:SAM-dependent methyltransferase n=1 Tax=Cytobacillus sp. IB215316 TaxID=3097354 RepID=UPI002A129D12|nr:SAM-dependent methyltransferase [Cytobacillus sp. IB215316]MDX8362571.1 SAM-dependent methyltransferase [Cytobacillus sp. IB215316]
MYSLKPIAYVKNNREEIADDNWGDVLSLIELTEDFSEESLLGIEEFSHVDVIFLFDKVADSDTHFSARHPRNNQNYPKVGIFAQRGKNRPNKLGLTTVKLVKREGKTLFVTGLDAIHNTPVIDIKPVMEEFLPKGTIKQPRWSIDLMTNYWKEQ